MPVQIFVDKLNHDKTAGVTTNQAMLLENGNRIKIINVEHSDDISVLVFELGRYVGVITKDINGTPGMMFFDFQKNREKALHATKIFAYEVGELIMKNFEEVTKKYDENYNLVELVVRSDFPSDFSAS